MIKNICKLFIMVFLLTGVVSAEEYTQVHAEHILVKTAAEAQQIKKILITAEILNIMPEHILFVRQVKTEEI